MAKVKGTKITFEKNEEIIIYCDHCLEPTDEWGKCDCRAEEADFFREQLYDDLDL